MVSKWGFPVSKKIEFVWQWKAMNDHAAGDVKEKIKFLAICGHIKDPVLC